MVYLLIFIILRRISVIKLNWKNLYSSYTLWFIVYLVFIPNGIVSFGRVSLISLHPQRTRSTAKAPSLIGYKIKSRILYK